MTRTVGVTPGTPEGAHLYTDRATGRTDGRTIEGVFYTRTYVGELHPGDVLATGGTVITVESRPNERVTVWTDNQFYMHASYHRSSTLLAYTPPMFSVEDLAARHNVLGVY